MTRDRIVGTMIAALLVVAVLAWLFANLKVNATPVGFAEVAVRNADLAAAGLVVGSRNVRGGMVDRLPEVYSVNIEDRR